jgi:hypothetical protein
MVSSPTDGFPDRRHKRYILPTTLSPVVAEFLEPDGTLHTGRLWDISSAGVCLQLGKAVTIPENIVGQLSVRQPNSLDEVSREVQVCWTSAPSPVVSLIGMVFSGGLLEPGTFLDDYMKASWLDRLERYRKVKVPRVS